MNRNLRWVQDGDCPSKKFSTSLKYVFFMGVAWPTKKIHGGSGHLVSMVIAKVWCVAPARTTQSSPILHATGLAAMTNLGVDHGSVCQSLLVAGSSMVLWIIIMVPSKLTVFGRIADGTLFLHDARCDFVHLSMRITGLSCILIFFWVSGSLTHGQLSQILHAGKDNYCFAVNVKTGPKQTLSNSSLLARAISTNTSY